MPEEATSSTTSAAAAGFDLSLIPEGSRVLLDGIVLQERARNTRSASALKHGFRKLVWKEVKLSLTDIEVILQKEQYSQKSSNVTVDGAEPLVLGRVQLKDVESCGSITDAEGGWRIEATNLLVVKTGSRGTKRKLTGLAAFNLGGSGAASSSSDAGEQPGSP